MLAVQMAAWTAVPLVALSVAEKVGRKAEDLAEKSVEWKVGKKADLMAALRAELRVVCSVAW